MAPQKKFLRNLDPKRDYGPPATVFFGGNTVKKVPYNLKLATDLL